MIEILPERLDSKLSDFPRVSLGTLASQATIARSILDGGGCVETIFIDECDLTPPSSFRHGSPNQEAIPSYTREDYLRSRLSTSRIIDIHRTDSDVPHFLQKEIRDIGEAPWSGVIVFYVLLKNERKYQVTADVDSPYFFASLPGEDCANDIVGITPLDENAIRCSKTHVSICIYRRP